MKIQQAIQLLKQESTAQSFLHLLGLILHRSSPSCTSVYETSSAASVAFLETSIQESRSQNSNQQISIRPFELVAKERKLTSGEAIHTSDKFKSSDNRCFEVGFRRALEQSDFSRPVDEAGEQNAYKPSRVGSSVQISSTFPSTTQGSQCVDKVRQHNCSTIREQARRDTVTSSLLSGMELMESGIENNMFLTAAHLLGRLNILADLSRVKIRSTEWTLNDAIVQKFFLHWGVPKIDLFATEQNRKVQMFFSWQPSQLAFATDALSISWESMEAYAFPPLTLIPKVLQHMKSFRCQLILTAPQWPRRSWYTDLLQMLIDCSVRLPIQ